MAQVREHRAKKDIARGTSLRAVDFAEPRASVIVPAYNAAWSIERLLRSIQAQSLSDFEVIVVDDGSDDDTAAVVSAVAAKDPRIRMIRQQNQGVAIARNRALREARGQYVAPVDSDDLWHADYLREMIAALEAPEAAAAPFAFCYSNWIDTDDRFSPTEPPATPPRSDLIGLLRCNAVGNGSCAVFRKRHLLAVGGYDASLRSRGANGGEDWKLVMQLAAISPALVVPKFLVGYRRSPNSLSANPAVQARSSLVVLKDMRRLFPQIPRRHFWAARTDFLVWIMPQWLRTRDYGALLKYGALAFIANPLWFSSRSARSLLAGMAHSILGGEAAASPATAVFGATITQG